MQEETSKHHILLHYNSRSPQSSRESLNNAESKTVLSGVTRRSETNVIVPTAIIQIIHPSTKRKLHCRALLDSGSQISLITKPYVKKLRLPWTQTSLSVTGIENTKDHKDNGLVSLSICSKEDSKKWEVEAYILNRITMLMPPHYVQEPTWESERTFPLADPQYRKAAKVDILLGADIYYDLLKPQQFVENGHVKAQNTYLGWVICGKHLSKQTSKANVMLSTTAMMTEQMERLWQLDEVQTVKPGR